ncbi:MAG: DHH family phosphoesterase [Spirochaetales bacterium]|nr:DHH family phosphoesterase [Spirochaetales bacterium]
MSPSSLLLNRLSQHPDFSHIQERDYFSPDLEIDSPLLLPDMEMAVLLLRQVLDQGGHILLCGDRDVDGVTSVSLLAHFLRSEQERRGAGSLTLRVSSEGDDYGLSGAFYEEIKTHRADLLITLDMGTSNGAEIKELRARGSNVIVLDHHQLGDSTWIGDYALVNPVRIHPDCKIATVGLAFKFILAYALSFTREWNLLFTLDDLNFRLGAYIDGESPLPREALPVKDYRLGPLELDLLRRDPRRNGRILFARILAARPRLFELVLAWTDLVALGLMTDLVPLRGENRKLVRLGLGLSPLARRRSFREGLSSLMNAQRLDQESLTSRDLSFSLGPALNAAGRMGKTELAVQLLTARKKEDAREYSSALLRLNEERKARTEENWKIVREMLQANPARKECSILFCFDPALKSGVSGIMATRLVEEYRRPVIFINPDGAHARGSIRRYQNEDVLEILRQSARFFEQYGGHKEAAGFSIAYEQIDPLENHLRELFAQWQPGERHDSGAHLVLSASQISFRTYLELSRLEPFGQGNPPPLIELAGVRVHKHSVMKSIHLKFKVAQCPAEFVLWHRGADFIERGGLAATLRLRGHLEKNTFAGRRTLQFRVQEYSLSGEPEN